MPTLSEARKFLSRYAGQGNSFTDRLNFVIARLLPEGNWKGSTVPLRFAVYEDAQQNRFITLPRQMETVLAGAYQAPDPDTRGPNWFWCGQPIPIRNGWYEFSASGPGDYAGSDWQRGIIRLQGQYTTFYDWTEPRNIRIRREQTEPNAKVIVRGYVNGQKIWTTIDGTWQEGVQLDVTTTAVDTTTQQFDGPPYEVVKTETVGRIRLYAVDDDDNEVLAGYYDPAELNPSYIRFKVPTCEATAP